MPTPNVTATGNVTASGNTVVVASSSAAAASIAVAGTWTGTLTFEVTADGSTWTSLSMTPLAGGAAATTTTGNGLWGAGCAGSVAIRARASAAITGTAVVVLNASFATMASLVAPGVALTAGSVPYINANGVLTQDNANHFWDGTNHRLGVGTAAPGFPLDVVGQANFQGLVSLLAALNLTGAHGEALAFSWTEENLTLSTGGATTDTAANLLPANALILAVVGFVTTTIATATNWQLGDATTAGRFTATSTNLTAGQAGPISLAQWQGGVTTNAAGPVQNAAAKVRVTTTGTPSAGAIRICVASIVISNPTS